jgi:hypothetical protein
MDEIPKPRELLAARTSAEVLFDLLRHWFEVPEHVTVDLRAVDSAVSELGEPQLVMAMAMRKLQALHLLTTPGVRTTTDVVLTVIQDLERALLQAPSMHLKREAAEADWDAALAALMLIPLLYSGMYLWSFWDPFDRMENLPVALVNADEGAEVDGEEVNAGDELTGTLLDRGDLDWHL